MKALPMLALSLLPIAMAGCIAVAKADPAVTTTVDGVDYPVCELEDCSDQIGQIGVWIDPDTGNRWLSLGESSYFIHPSR